MEEYYTIEDCKELLTKSKELLNKIKELEVSLYAKDQKIKELEDKIRQFTVIAAAFDVQNGLPGQNN